MKRLFFSASLFVSTAMLWAQTVESATYGKTSDGEDVVQYTLKNENNMIVKAISFGCTVTDIIVPDKDMVFENVTLNLPNLAAYESNKNFMGPIVGRFGNRLAKSQFKIGGQTYKIASNEGDTALHGGTKGFDKMVWKSESIKGNDFAGVRFWRTSPDGEMGFPGNMLVEVSYKLNNKNEFSIEYKASADKPTVCNLTWHPYFNLAGAGNGSILTHHFKVNAANITPVDEKLIPTGELMVVQDTPFDFRKSWGIGERLHQKHPQLAIPMAGGAYDHNFVIYKPVDTMWLVCEFYYPKNGRKVEVFSEEPCLQFYSGQGWDGSVIGANGKAYYKFAGFVIEPQHHPDQPNQPNFYPSTLLTPGETFKSKSIYKFSVF